jgi:hypothetical protein
LLLPIGIKKTFLTLVLALFTLLSTLQIYSHYCPLSKFMSWICFSVFLRIFYDENALFGVKSQ